jgi:hypothetical protein
LTSLCSKKLRSDAKQILAKLPPSFKRNYSRFMSSLTDDELAEVLRVNVSRSRDTTDPGRELMLATAHLIEQELHYRSERQTKLDNEFSREVAEQIAIDARLESMDVSE